MACLSKPQAAHVTTLVYLTFTSPTLKLTEKQLILKTDKWRQTATVVSSTLGVTQHDVQSLLSSSLLGHQYLIHPLQTLPLLCHTTAWEPPMAFH